MPTEPIQDAAPSVATEPACPKCGGEMWDNRESKRNPRAPDYKCKDRGCDGVIWPPRQEGEGPPAPAGTADDPACPVCGGKMWDDRNSKRNPRAPDFKCRNKPKSIGGEGCPGVIWPPRDGEARSAGGGSGAGGRATGAPAPRAQRPIATPPPPVDDAPPFDDADFTGDDDELPF